MKEENKYYELKDYDNYKCLDDKINNIKNYDWIEFDISENKKTHSIKKFIKNSNQLAFCEVANYETTDFFQLYSKDESSKKISFEMDDLYVEPGYCSKDFSIHEKIYTKERIKKFSNISVVRILISPVSETEIIKNHITSIITGKIPSINDAFFEGVSGGYVFNELLSLFNSNQKETINEDLVLLDDVNLYKKKIIFW